MKVLLFIKDLFKKVLKTIDINKDPYRVYNVNDNFQYKRVLI